MFNFFRRKKSNKTIVRFYIAESLNPEKIDLISEHIQKHVYAYLGQQCYFHENWWSHDLDTKETKIVSKLRPEVSKDVSGMEYVDVTIDLSKSTIERDDGYIILSEEINPFKVWLHSYINKTTQRVKGVWEKTKQNDADVNNIHKSILLCDLNGLFETLKWLPTFNNTMTDEGYQLYRSEDKVPLLASELRVSQFQWTHPVSFIIGYKKKEDGTLTPRYYPTAITTNSFSRDQKYIYVGIKDDKIVFVRDHPYNEGIRTHQDQPKVIPLLNKDYKEIGDLPLRTTYVYIINKEDQTNFTFT